jgi:hypothetical protein
LQYVGAGWGGCTVSLVPEAEVASFIKKVSETYAPYKGLEGEALSEVIFATRPSTGACGQFFFLDPVEKDAALTLLPSLQIRLKELRREGVMYFVCIQSAEWFG